MSLPLRTPIVVASNNSNKVRELQTVANEFGIELLSPQDAARAFDLGAPPEVEETADSYRGNALLKASAFRRWSNLPALGDDSGLEVEALAGRPGVRSARYGGEGLSDRERYLKLLAELEQVLQQQQIDERGALFRCYLVLSLPDGSLQEAEGILQGEVLEEPRGENGFGYDPIVRIFDLGKTFAEVEFATVCRMGFRAKAARELFSQLAIA